MFRNFTRAVWLRLARAETDGVFAFAVTAERVKMGKERDGQLSVSALSHQEAYLCFL